MSKNVEPFLKCLSSFWDIWWEFSIYKCTPFLNLDYFTFYFLVSRVLCTFWNSTIYQLCGCWRIFPIFLLLVCLVECVLCHIQVYQIQEVPLINFALSACVTGAIYRKWSHLFTCSILLPTFSSIRLSVAIFYAEVFDSFRIKFCALG